MLNKNQSKKSNSWKFCVVIPALAAFVLLFQVEVIAKERAALKPEKIVQNDKEKITDTDVYKIKKNTTDQELKVMAETLKQKHNIDAEVSDLKRNSANELTGIKLELKKGSELEKTFLLSGTKAIKECGVIVVTYDNGTKKINFISDNNIDKSKIEEELKAEEKEHQNSNNNSNTNSNKDDEANRNTDKSTTTSTNANTNVTVNANVNTDAKTSVSTSTSSTKVVVTSNANGKTSNVIINTDSQPNIRIQSDKLVIVDGVTVIGTTTDDLQKLSIKTMEVYTGADAIAKYGEEGKNGVIVIKTKK